MDILGNENKSMLEQFAENVIVFVGGLTGTIYVWASVGSQLFSSINHIFEGVIYACITTFVAYGTKEICKNNWRRWFGPDDNDKSGDAPNRNDQNKFHP